MFFNYELIRNKESVLIMVLTYDTFSKGLVLEGGEAEVPDLDTAGGTGDEDVVALEVPVNHRGLPRVQEYKALQ